jgi:anti-sigma B factor antagonist
MRFLKEIVNGIPVFRLQERKLDTSNSGLLKGELTDYISRGNISSMVIDLSGVESCDSSGLSVLLVAKRLIDDRNGIYYVIPSEKIKHLLEITKLDRALFYAANIEEAIHGIKHNGRG